MEPGPRVAHREADRLADRILAGKWRSANVLLTTATQGDEATSRSSMIRPRRRRMPSVSRSWASTSLTSARGPLPGLGRGLADDRRRVPGPDLHREPADDAGALDAGHRAHALEHLVVEQPRPAASPGSCPAASCRSTWCRPAGSSAVIRRCVSKPGRLLCSRRKPRIIRPAPTRSTIDSTTSATSSALRPAPPRRRSLPRPPSFSTSFRSTREACSAGRGRRAGSRRRRSAARSRARARRRGCGAADPGSLPGRSARTAGFPRRRAPGPKPQPTSESSRFSVRSCPIRRRRPAPAATRRASSFCRAAPAARSRLATFAQAISSTKLTAPSRKVSPRRGAAEVGVVERAPPWPRRRPASRRGPPARSGGDRGRLGLGRAPP